MLDVLLQTVRVDNMKEAAYALCNVFSQQNEDIVEKVVAEHPIVLSCLVRICHEKDAKLLKCGLEALEKVLSLDDSLGLR